MGVIIWLNGPFGFGNTTTARALLRRVPRAVLFDPEPFGTALQQTVDNVESVTDFQDLRGWPALVVETARILRKTYAETLIMPLTVLEAAAANALAAGLAAVDPDVRRFRMVAPEATLRARIPAAPRGRGTARLVFRPSGGGYVAHGQCRVRPRGADRRPPS